MYVDLHIHTISSDGTWDIDELLAHIRNTEISLFSVTDHDTIENSILMAQKVGGSDLKHVIGVEVSCTYKKELYHITAYDFDWHNHALLDLLEANQRIMEKFNDDTIKHLETNHPDVEYAKYEAHDRDKRRGGWKALNFLLDANVVTNIPEYFHMLKELDHALVFREPADVIRTIQEAQGVAFLAHPHLYFQGNKMPDEELEEWLELGIPGIECYSSYCSMQAAEDYVKFCRKHNLLISGGSDCHGTFIPSRKLGHPRLTLDMLNLGFI